MVGEDFEQQRDNPREFSFFPFHTLKQIQSNRSESSLNARSCRDKCVVVVAVGWWDSSGGIRIAAVGVSGWSNDDNDRPQIKVRQRRK